MPPNLRLLRRLDHGGVGEVWEARDAAERPVALKIVRHLERPAAAAELEGLQHIAALAIPHIVPIHEWWTAEDQGSRSLFILMPLAEHDLLALVERRPYSGYAPDELRPSLTSLVVPLDMLLEAGYQHGDVKPGNVLLCAQQVWLCDFGCLSRVGERQPDGFARFTPPYAAPELVARGSVARTTDQYSLAMLYLEMRTGAFALDHPALTSHERDILSRALALEPGDRYPSCREFVERLLTASV